MALLHFIKAEGRKPDKAMPWITFHFLPGLDVSEKYKFNYDAHEKVLSDNTTGIGTRKINKAEKKKRLNIFTDLRKKGGLLKWDYLQQLICWPGSPSSNAMIEDTLRIAQAYKEGVAKESELQALIRCCVTSDSLADKDGFKKLLTDFDSQMGRLWAMEGVWFGKFLAALVGVRMHIFNDTWAHQGFMGIRSDEVNDLTNLKCVSQNNGKPENLPWAARISEASDLTYYGHGRADTFPDHPSIKLTYMRPWDAKTISRNNPVEFKKAYQAMVKWLKKIGAPIGWDKQRQPAPGFLPSVINEKFFRNMRKKDGKKGWDEKGHRCDFLNKYIEQHDGLIFRPFARVNEQFGLIRQMYKRSKIDLAYFNLASIYHQNWFEKQLTTRLNGIKANNVNDLLNKIMGSPAAFAKAVK